MGGGRTDTGGVDQLAMEGMSQPQPMDSEKSGIQDSRPSVHLLYLLNLPSCPCH